MPESGISESGAEGTTANSGYKGCVAKTGGSLVKVAKVLTALSHRHSIYESQVPEQKRVTSNPTLSYCACGAICAIP